jgi:Cu/Ag efflux protein CusF
MFGCLMPTISNREAAMKAAKIVLVGVAAAALFISAATAQQNTTGMITKIDRLNGMVSIQPVQSGTVGANTAGAAQDFKVPDAGLLESVHAGDRVTFSTTDDNGVKTITKLQKQ